VLWSKFIRVILQKLKSSEGVGHIPIVTHVEKIAAEKPESQEIDVWFFVLEAI
jgi:hypothetical protein